MWIRKSQVEIAQERRSRRIKFEFATSVLIFLAAIFVYFYFGSIERIIEAFKQNPEGIFSLLFLPVIIYFSYRNYVLHGSLTERPGMICLECEKGMGYSDDGWGFKVYGRKKPKWHQVRACATPEKCDIVYQFEAKLINNGEIK